MKLIVLVLALTIYSINGANILYLNGICSPSHHFWNRALVNGLVARGHNLTVISPDQEKNPPKNARYILFEGLYNNAYYEIVNSLIKFEHEQSALTAPVEFQEYMAFMCKDDFKFDLVINDATQGGCLLGFLHKFKYPPLISTTAFSQPPYFNALVGGHHYYSYIPHYVLPYHGELNIWQRFYNFVVHMAEILHWEYQFVHDIDKIIENAYGTKIPPVSELEKRTAIAFVSTSTAYDNSRPLPENVIPVGGLHITDPKPLPKDIEGFINSSKNGAILFTLGSNIQATAMSLEKQQILLDAFEQFPDYHFMWKFEKPKIDLKLPKNVIIRTWLPQADILNHPKTKLFITHAGLLGTLEAISRGVPMIGMPFGFDQNINLFKSIQRGIAVKVDFQTMTKDVITKAIQEVLENPKYMRSVKKLSAILRDQKETPLERAVWWAEWAE